MNFTVTFYKRFWPLVDKQEVVIGTREIEETEKYCIENDIEDFHYTKLPYTIPSFLSYKFFCTIPIELVYELNKIHGDCFINNQDIRIRVKGNFNNFVYKKCGPGAHVNLCYSARTKTLGLGGSMIISYTLDKDKLLDSWKKAGYPLMWKII